MSFFLNVAKTRNTFTVVYLRGKKVKLNEISSFNENKSMKGST